MNIMSIMLPNIENATLEDFRKTVYAGTAFGKLLLALASAPWMQEFEVVSRLHFNDDKDVEVKLWLRHDFFLTEQDSKTIRVPCTLTEVPTVSGVARFAREALQAGISSRTAVKEMLSKQVGYANLAQGRILELFAKSVFLNATEATPASVNFHRHFAHCRQESADGSFIVKMSELFNENPTVYVVRCNTVDLSRFNGPWDKSNQNLPAGSVEFKKPT